MVDIYYFTQVYSEDIENPGILNSNLGMYRIQISGNDYELNKEVGMHYQIHRGIGVHQKKAIKKGEPLKVSIFVGGPPHILLHLCHFLRECQNCLL